MKKTGFFFFRITDIRSDGSYILHGKKDVGVIVSDHSLKM